MPKILIITPFFAPQSHAAVFRAYKLARALPGLGWDVHVLTVDKNYNFNEDPKLLDALPDSVQVHTAKYVEPSIRGARMALGGKDRSWSKVKPTQETTAQSDQQTEQATEKSNDPSLLKKGYQWSVDNFLHQPDAYWSWYKPAVSKAKKIIEKHRIDIVYTSSSPFTTLQVGETLQAATGVKWCADIRDPLAYSNRFSSGKGEHMLRHWEITRDAYDLSDLVTTLTSSHPLIIADQYPEVDQEKVHYIATGLDEALIPQDTPERKKGVITYVGEFLESYSDDFFEIIAEAVKNPEVEQCLKIRFIGRAEINAKIIAPRVERYGLEAHFEFIDHLSQNELYGKILESQAALLCTGRTYPWWCNFSKMVDYIALKTPVIAVVPDPSEARKWLQKSKLGIFLDGSIEQATKTFTDFILSDQQQSPDQAICDTFTMKHQAKQFDQLLRSTVNK